MSNQAGNLLFIAGGSGGDVYPPLAIAKALHERGHRVLFMTSQYFEPAARRAGLDFAGIGTAEEYLRRIRNPDLWKVAAGVRMLFDASLSRMPELYRLIEERYIPGETLVIAPSGSFGARVANEKLGIPLLQFHVELPSLRGEDQFAPGTPGVLKPMISGVRKLAFAGVDLFLLDPAVAPRLNAFRKELGLPPIKRVFHHWIHSSQPRIGLFPDWFRMPGPGWPLDIHLVGFPLAGSGEQAQLPEDLEAFLGSGEPPIVFTWGTAMQFAGKLIEASVEACRILNRRGILLTEFSEQVPANLPEGVRHFRSAPFHALFPRVAAVVHHGGVGTLSQALAAGVPQLVTPFNFDQPRNAAILRRLGAGDSMRVKSYRAPLVAAALQKLIASPAVAAQCHVLKERIAGTDAIGEACRLIEAAIPGQTRQNAHAAL